jgi:two-component system sensor histidine kinase BaeS
VTAGDGGDRGRWGRHETGDWQGPPWTRAGRRGPHRGFGCLFGLVFLIVAGTLVTVAATVVSALGPIAGIVTVLVVIGILIGFGRMLRRTARSLDRIVEAAARVEAGDYSVRVGTPERSMRSVRDLSRGFDTMVERLDVDERQRRLLLADVSHELRTPLTVIAGDLEAMLDGVHPADPVHLEAVLDETRVMRRLIEDLRTMALSEAGTLALHPEPTDPDVLIEEVVRSFETAAGMAGLTVTADVPVDLPIVDVDPVRIREVLANLVGNAIRHTPAGGSVTIRGSVAVPWLEVWVVDTGPGIDPDLLPQVFERFVSSAGSGGSGLGLAIARSLVEAHGGSLEVEASGSAGTTFRARLPHP